MKKLIILFLTVNLFMAGLSISAAAQSKKGKTKPKPPVSSGALTDEEVVFGLKDVLSNGLNHANGELSKRGGFYNDPRVKISFPPALQGVEKELRTLKYDDMIDDLVVSMNRAAEESIMENAYIFNDVVRQMAIVDPKTVLAGPKDAATQYLRRTNSTALLARMLPLVTTAVSEAGVLAQYKTLIEKGGGQSVPAGQKPFNINEYVAQKVLDAMFLLIADEEKRIRADPAARTTAILQKIFGNTAK